MPASSTQPIALPAAPCTLPAARQFAVTWSIPDPFGGMTGALLHRSRTFVRSGGAGVGILTFDTRPDYPAIRERLLERGDLIPGVTLHNIYEHFRTASRAPSAVRVTPIEAVRPHDEELLTPTGSVRRWRSGVIAERTEHRRADGSLAVLEETQPGGSRLVTSFDAQGETTGQWESAASFRFAWLDHLVGGEPAVMIVDSKTAARFMQLYRRPTVATIHLVHGSHHDVDGRLTAQRRRVFERLDRWDAVVLLTDRQREATLARLGDSGNLEVVPNGVGIPDRMPRLPRDRRHGVIVAGLSGRKRIEHALRIIAGVRALGIPVTAEIVGDGDRRAALEHEAARLGLTGVVRFSGHAPHAADRFGDGAWTLLTSRSEGEPLTLLEAMARGCLPVAYDIPYGPADIVEDGRNGRLIADGDIAAATQALAELCVLDDDAIATMRRRARSTAQEHGEDGMVARWARVEQAAMRRALSRPVADETPVDRIRIRRRGGRLSVSARVPGARRGARVEVRLSNREGATAVATARAWGGWRFARFDERASAELPGRVRAFFLVREGEHVAGVDAGVRHPDPRSVAQRLKDRVLRSVR